MLLKSNLHGSDAKQAIVSGAAATVVPGAIATRTNQISWTEQRKSNVTSDAPTPALST